MNRSKNFIFLSAIVLCLSSCGEQKHVHTFVNLESIDQYTHKGLCKECGEEVIENHVFDQEIKNEKYLKREKTCSEYAQYYRSCICGKSSDETIRSVSIFQDVEGGLAEHNLQFFPRKEPENGENGNEAYYQCKNCKSLYNESKQPISEIPIIKSDVKFYFKNRYNGETKDLVYSKAREYLICSDPAKYLYNTVSGSGDLTEGINVTWVNNGGIKPFKLEFATDSEFKYIYRTYDNLSVTSMSVYNLYPGNVFMRLSDSTGTSIVDNLFIKESLRTIHTNGVISNMRDLGGWNLKDGKKIKYGLLYRSAAWDHAISCKNLLQELGMKTELDIRLSSESQDYTKSKSPIDGINFVNYGIGQYTQVIRYSSYNSNIQFIFNNVLSKEESYPLTYHCSAGADRTGTLSFLIGGLLGMSYEELVQDFELTTFYHSRRWRSDIKKNADGSYSFDPSGIMQNDSSNYVAFDLMYKDIQTNYMKNTSDLSVGISNFLVSIGVKTESLDKIKEILKD